MKVRKAVLPVAGLGTRFLPATKASPKEMLPLVDKPMIQYVVEEAVEAGIEDIILITGRGKNSIEDHFDVSYELERVLMERNKNELLETVQSISNLANFSYIRQKEPKGLGDAILKAKNIVGNEPFAILLGDDIIHYKKPTILQLVEVSEKYNSSVIGVEKVPMEDISKYGAIKFSETDDDNIFDVLDLVEKPPVKEAPSDIAIIGRYVLTPKIFDILKETPPDKSGEIQLTNALRTLLEYEKIFGLKFEGKRYDAGSKIGFLKATVEFALRDKDLKDDFRNYLKSLDIKNIN